MGSAPTYLLLGFRGWAEVGFRPLWTNDWQGKGPSVRAARPAARGLHVLSAKETGVRRGIQVDRPVPRLSHPHPPPQPQPHRQPPQQQLQSGSNFIKSNKVKPVWILQRTKNPQPNLKIQTLNSRTNRWTLNILCVPFQEERQSYLVSLMLLATVQLAWLSLKVAAVTAIQC